MFSRNDLIKLMLPLIVEQILGVAVGMVDVVMVAYAGEAAVSGVSSVDAIAMLIIFVMSAMATGGAVVASQYMGRHDHKNACLAANQLILVTFIAGMIFMLISLFGNNLILGALLGDIEQPVKENARIYYYITAVSFPFLGVYNGCAAIFRSMGNSKVSMMTSLLMNGINIIGNAILIYGFHMGAAGVGIATLVSRIIAAVVMILLVRNEKFDIHIDRRLRLGYYPKMIKNILRIGIPNGLENGVFQFGKVILQSLIASLGTVAIAANAIASNLAGIEIIAGGAIGIGMITVVGQCVGAGEYEQAKKYTKQLVLASYGLMILTCIIVLVLRGPLISIYNLSDEIAFEADRIIIWHSVAAMVIWPLSFTLPSALRAASDATYTMIISIVSMWLCRIVLAYVLSRYFNFGVFGVWVAMTIDWAFRAIFFIWRFLSGRWLHVVGKTS